MANSLIPIEAIQNKIFYIRGKKVMLDFDLAELYEVKTFVLNQAVKRNIERFPEDFMFRISEKDFAYLKSQNVISSSTWGGRRTLPYAFTEQGVAMLSSVLRSKHAIFVNIQIMRTFVQIREFLTTHTELARKIEELERKHNDHDEKLQIVFQAIKQLIQAPDEPKSKIGFKTD